MCTMRAVSLRHAPSDATAVRPTPLIGGWGGSAVDIVGVAPGTSTSSSVGRASGNRYKALHAACHGDQADQEGKNSVKRTKVHD